MNRRRPENANSIFCLFNQLHNFFQQIEIISEKKGSNIIVRRLGLATIILKDT